MKKMITMPALFAGIFISAAISHPIASAQDAPQRIEITVRQFAYAPAEITLKKGRPVVLVLKSADVAHGLRIRELKVDIRLSAGGTKEVQITPQRAGDFVGHCSVFCGSGHATMALKVHVVS